MKSQRSLDAVFGGRITGGANSQVISYDLVITAVPEQVNVALESLEPSHWG